MDKVVGLHVSFLLAQTNGCTCVDFGCTHPIDGLFWSLPIYLLGFFSKCECWGTNSIMSLYHFFLGLSLAFLYHKVSYHYEMWKTIHMTNFLNEICLINIEIISFNSFKFYKNENWKIMQELIKIKHVNLIFNIKFIFEI
jgi:hypothetical protein